MRPSGRPESAEQPPARLWGGSARARGTTRQILGHFGRWPNWANAPGEPPARFRGTLGDGPTGQTRPGNHPPGCGALWEMAQLGKRARGTTRQAAGHFGRWPNWANAFGEPPARLRGGSFPAPGAPPPPALLCPPGRPCSLAPWRVIQSARKKASYETLPLR